MCEVVTGSVGAGGTLLAFAIRTLGNSGIPARYAHLTQSAAAAADGGGGGGGDGVEEIAGSHHLQHHRKCQGAQCRHTGVVVGAAAAAGHETAVHNDRCVASFRAADRVCALRSSGGCPPLGCLSAHPSQLGTKGLRA